MRTEILRLPNGFVTNEGRAVKQVEIRAMTGEDENYLRDKKETRKDNVLLRLLQRTIVSFGDDTPTEEAKRLVWQYLPMNDLMFLLIRFRAISMGPVYKFTRKCPHCGHTESHSIDLDTLPVNYQADEHFGKSEFTASTTDIDGAVTQFRFKTLVATDQHLFSLVADMYPTEKSTRQMLIQVQEVNGEQPVPEKFAMFSSYLLGGIREELDKVTGGIDMRIISACSKCDGESTATLPVELASFFSRTAIPSNTTTARAFLARGTLPASLAASGGGAEKRSSNAPPTS